MLVGAALLFILAAMAYRDKLERMFRIWHIKRIRRGRSSKSQDSPSTDLQ